MEDPSGTGGSGAQPGAAGEAAPAGETSGPGPQDETTLDGTTSDPAPQDETSGAATDEAEPGPAWK